MWRCQLATLYWYVPHKHSVDTDPMLRCAFQNSWELVIHHQYEIGTMNYSLTYNTFRCCSFNQTSNRYSQYIRENRDNHIKNSNDATHGNCYRLGSKNHLKTEWNHTICSFDSHWVILISIRRVALHHVERNKTKESRNTQKSTAKHLKMNYDNKFECKTHVLAWTVTLSFIIILRRRIYTFELSH